MGYSIVNHSNALLNCYICVGKMIIYNRHSSSTHCCFLSAKLLWKKFYFPTIASLMKNSTYILVQIREIFYYSCIFSVYFGLVWLISQMQNKKIVSKGWIIFFLSFSLSTQFCELFNMSSYLVVQGRIKILDLSWLHLR